MRSISWCVACMMSISMAVTAAPLTAELGNGPPIPAPPELSASGYLLMDATNGEILIEHNADQPLPPASLTKMMTAYIVEREIAEGRVLLPALSPTRLLHVHVDFGRQVQCLGYVGFEGQCHLREPSARLRLGLR